MPLKKFTLDSIDYEERKWKELVVQNEINLIKHYAQSGGLGLAYEMAEKNAWIVRTLRDKKKRYLFTTCKNLVMIGSGMYPYSMFDVHKQYPEINQIGLEIDESRAEISRRLIGASPAKDAIEILTMDALEYDYSGLGHDDLVFVSVDVDHKEIINKVLQTSKAHINICAPYDKTWLINLVRSLKSS